MKKISLLLLLLVSTYLLSGQDQSNYKKYIKIADSLYQAKDYLASARAYDRGFLELNGKAYANDRYNAACSYSLAEKVDSSFYHLFYLLEKQGDYLYNSYTHVMKVDQDLANLRKDDRWKEFKQKLDSLKTEKEKDLDMELVNQLDSIYEKDQGIRNTYFEMSEKYERDSPEMKAFYKKWRITDSTNEVAVTKILDERGWLGSDVIGSRGNSTLFLVIQHAPLETQEKYLPMMQEAVKKGNANASSLALLEDRINLRNKRHQLYGSQIGSHPETGEKIVLPLADPERVDIRRQEMGLGPLDEYTQRFGFKWDVELYKKQLPEIEKFYFNKDSK